MSYLNPRRWGDVDAGGNAVDWSTRKNKLLYPGYEMLRLALVERCELVSLGVPAVLQVPGGPGKIYTGETWTSSFHSIVTTLIKRFVNFEDSGGDWHGVDENLCAPLWTEASILAAIGASSRVQPSSLFLADWSLQQYRILNRLRWLRSGCSRADKEGKTGNYNFTYATAVATYVAAPWVFNAFIWNLGLSEDFDNHEPEGEFLIRRTRSKIFAWDGVIARKYLLPCRADFYTFVKPGAVFDGNPPLFDDEGMGFSADTWWGFQYDTPFSRDTIIISEYPTNREDPLSKPTASPQQRGWIAGPTPIIPVAVMKFDGLGGFKFVD